MRELSVAEQRYQAVLAVISDLDEDQDAGAVVVAADADVVQAAVDAQGD